MKKKRPLLKKYKNAFFEAIRKEGLSPHVFQTSDEETEWSDLHLYFVIELPDSGPSFWVIGTTFDNRFTIKFSRFPRGDFNTYRWNKFDFVLRYFYEWLRTDVKDYLDERNLPDLWSELETYRSIFNDVDITEESSSNFSSKEQSDIKHSIEKYKLLLEENFSPNREQSQFINEQLDYLANAVERLNRFDWRGLAISTLMGIAINLSVDTEKGKLLFSLFQQALQTATKLLH